MRGGHEAPAMRKAPFLRSHIDDRRPLRSARGKSPTQLPQLGAVLSQPNDRSHIGRPDVVPRLQIGRTARSENTELRVAERVQVGAVGDLIAVIITHVSNAQT